MATTFQYKKRDETLGTVDAETPEAAIATAPDILPNSGVMVLENPAVPTTTVAEAYKDFNVAPYDQSPDSFLTSMLDEARTTATTPLDEKAIRRKKLAEYQAETNANNRIFASKLAELSQDKKRVVGRARAMEASGTGGYGQIVTAQKQGQKPIDTAALEHEAKIQSIMNTARAAADTEVANKRTARRQGYNDYITYLKAADDRKKTNAETLAQSIIDQDLDITDIDPAVISEAVQAYGITEASLRSALAAKKKALDEEKRDRAFEEADAELKYNEETGQYESTATQEPIQLGDGEVLIDPETGEVIYENVEDYAPDTTSDKVLSPTEAQTLGVPYGTTEAEAAAMGITPQKPPTDAQNRDSLFASRTRDADVTINGLESQITAMNPVKWSAYLAAENTALGNTLVPDTVRQQRQAERNFLNSVLRRESGAVISPTEFSEGARQYFPRPGDDAATLEQKRRNRQVVIDGLRSSAGSAYMSNRIRVKLSNGQTGTVDEADFDPNMMTKI